MLHTNEGEMSLQGTVDFSAVSKNSGALELVAYPEDELQEKLVSPEREGWSFDGWLDAEGNRLLPETLEAGKAYYANWTDKVPPILTLTCTGNVASHQEVTIMAEDIAGEVSGYYVGADNPKDAEVVYTGYDGESLAVKIENAGKYYFSVQDTCGNSNTESMEFVFVTFLVNEDEETECEKMLGRIGDTLRLPDAKKKGHSLSGWLILNEQEELQTPVKEYTFLEEVSFIPVFEPKQYHIFLDGNGGSCDVDKLEVTFGSRYPQLPDAKRVGYHFLGWAKTAEGELLQENEIYELADDSTLYAKWEPIRYTVCYIGNGSTGGEMESLECVYDVEFAHPRNAYTKEGYVFKGWSMSPGTISTQNALTARDRSYNGAEWLNEDVAVNITTEADSVINLYAVWQKVEVGVMDYRYCMGQYMYFACTTLDYKTENATDNGALFVGMTPAGGPASYGSNAVWATSGIRTGLNDLSLNDMTGLKTTNTTVNYSYAGMMWEYDPTRQSPCIRADQGYGPAIRGSAVANKVETVDYIFIPDLRDCYNYYTGNEWNWFWDMNLDGTPDTTKLVGMSADGANSDYRACTKAIADVWKNMGWNGRCWLRNQYTGYAGYPFYIAEYGVSSCNPSHPDYAAFYSSLSTGGKYLIRPMYTMKP